MGFLEYNLSWMIFNTILALIPVALTLFLRKRLPLAIQFAAFAVWLLFLPNTIYLITDLQHLPPQLIRSDVAVQIILIAQYATLTTIGVYTYMISLAPYDQVLKYLKIKGKSRDYAFFILNCVIAFAVVLGKFQRTHSWYTVTDPQRVVKDVVDTITSPLLILYTIFFAVVFNVIYFVLRSHFTKIKKKSKK